MSTKTKYEEYKETMVPLWAWTVHILCKIMIGVIKRRRLQKSNEDVNRMGRITSQNKLSILDTTKEELKKPIPNDSQETITKELTGAGTTTSTDTKLGAGEAQ